MRLLVLGKQQWEVRAVESDRGDCPVLEFLLGVPATMKSHAREMLAILDAVIPAEGPPRDSTFAKHLGNGIWELRKGRLRVLYFCDDGKVVIASHGFVKSTQKTPPEEIKAATRTRDRYQRAKKDGDLDVRCIGDER